MFDRDTETSCRGAKGELFFAMCSVRLGQKYYRVGGDSGGYRKFRVLRGKMVSFLNTDFSKEKFGSGAGFEPATFGL